MAASEIEVAAERVYAAECWLHTARQSGVDEWITQAADLLHRAIVEYGALAAFVAA